MNEKQRKLAEEIKEIILDYYPNNDEILMISLAIEPRSRGKAPINLIVHPDSIGKFVGKGQRHISKLISRLPSESFKKMNQPVRRLNKPSSYMGRHFSKPPSGRWIHIEGYARTLKSLTNECSNCGVNWDNHETCMEWT